MRPKRIDPFLVALAALILGFLLFKLRYWGLPYYWDEAWVYAPAVRAMYENGLGLLPGSIDAELSRGHPLMFHFVCAAWMHLFGASRSSLHAFALAASAGLLIVTYLLGVRTSSKEVGLGAVLLLLVNEAFLAQSGMLLPEILLALFLVMTILFYTSKYAVAYVLAAVCALMTKESAVVLIIALLIWQVGLVIQARDAAVRRTAWRWSLITIAPILLASIFFIAQKVRYGWFLYPEHLSFITWDLRDLTYKVKLCYAGLFEDQGRIVATYAFAYAVPVLWRGWDRRWAPVVILLYVTAIKVLVGRWPLPQLFTLIVPLLCLVVVFWLLFIKFWKRDPRGGEMVCIGFLFTIGYMTFCALNFFTDRYLICVFPIIALCVLTALHSALSAYHKLLFPICALLCSVAMLSQIGKHDKVGDTKLSYADAVTVYQQLIGYCEAQELQDQEIYGTFTERVYMTDVDAGYLTTSTSFHHVKDVISDRTTFAIFTNWSDKDVFGQLNELGFTRLERFEKGNAWGEVYGRAQ